MAKKQYSFLVIKYPHAETGQDALATVREIAKEGVVKLRDAVAITKTEKGKIKIHQTKDDSIGRGFVKGGVIGILFAALFGPVGWIAMGAAAGGLFASFDRGIKNRLLKELGQDMTPQESALALLVEEADWPEAVARMKSHGFGGTVVVQELVGDDIEQVEKLLEDPKTVEAAPEELDVSAEPVPVAIEEAVRGTVPLRIAEIESVDAENAAKLSAAGVKTTEDLLNVGGDAHGTPRSRQDDRHRRQAAPRVGPRRRPDADPGRRAAVQRPARGRRSRITRASSRIATPGTWRSRSRRLSRPSRASSVVCRPIPISTGGSRTPGIWRRSSRTDRTRGSHPTRHAARRGVPFRVRENVDLTAAHSWR